MKNAKKARAKFGISALNDDRLGSTDVRKFDHHQKSNDQLLTEPQK